MTRTFEHPHITRRIPGATHGKHDPFAGVLHCTVSPQRAGIADILAVTNGWELQGKGYNAHCVIDGSGHTAKCALDNQICWAVAGSNTGRLHVELIGFDTYTEHQWMTIARAGMKEAAKWFAYWAHEHDIPVRTSVNHGFATHAMYSEAFHKSDHTDPGPNFPWHRFMDDIRYYYKNGWVLP